jgi:hypothetical protein
VVGLLSPTLLFFPSTTLSVLVFIGLIVGSKGRKKTWAYDLKSNVGDRGSRYQTCISKVIFVRVIMDIIICSITPSGGNNNKI